MSVCLSICSLDIYRMHSDIAIAHLQLPFGNNVPSPDSKLYLVDNVYLPGASAQATTAPPQVYVQQARSSRC